MAISITSKKYSSVEYDAKKEILRIVRTDEGDGPEGVTFEYRGVPQVVYDEMMESISKYIDDVFTDTGTKYRPERML